MNKMIYLLSVLLFFSCSEDNITYSSEKKLVNFTIEQDPNAHVTIDEANKTISAVIDRSVDLYSITPIIEISDKATVNPKSGVVQNFRDKEKISYTVYAEDGSQQVYSVKVAHQMRGAKELLTFSFPDLYQTAQIEGNQIKMSVRYGTDLTKIIPQGTYSQGATISPELGVATDFSKPVVYTVTAEDQSTQQYTMAITVEPQETAVRAVWIPDPLHTPAMRTYENLVNTVTLLDELNFNTIYVATWVRTQTAFNSQVLLDNSTYKTKEDGNVFTSYKSGYNTPMSSPTNDPIKDLIVEAHKKGIKVVFWFEYGFMAAGGGTIPSTANNKIMEKHPEWIGVGNDGKVSNYNKSDYYFNAYNPEVQEFLLKLIEEAMTLYPDVDGIQGDDRMPAMPRNSGYDTYTAAKYKEEKGIVPPQDINEANWVAWRLNILNNFGKTLYNRIKAKKNTALVCFSPNPYPWSESNLMQQWPKWIENGIVELLSVQIYRNTTDAYKATLTEANNYVKAKTTKQLLNPGMILKNGATIMSEQLLLDQLNINREMKTNGEAFFYVDGLTDAAVQKVLKAYYPGKAKLPF